MEHQARGLPLTVSEHWHGEYCTVTATSGMTVGRVVVLFEKSCAQIGELAVVGEDKAVAAVLVQRALKVAASKKSKAVFVTEHEQLANAALRRGGTVAKYVVTVPLERTWETSSKE